MYPISWLQSEPKFQTLFHWCDSNISLVFRALLFRYASYTHQKVPVLEMGDGSPPRPILKILHMPVKVWSTRPQPEASPEVRIPLYTITLLLPPHHGLPDTSQCSGQLFWVLQTKNWDFNLPALPWTYCKSVFIWGHVAGEQREEGGGEDASHVFGATGPVVREGLRPPSVHCYCASAGFPGAVGGRKCSRDKSGFTHTHTHTHTHSEPQDSFVLLLVSEDEVSSRSSSSALGGQAWPSGDLGVQRACTWWRISGNSQPVYWCFEIWPPSPVCLLLFLVHR